MDLPVREMISLILKLGHDGAYKGRIHVMVPFMGRKNGALIARQQSYNDVHGWYRHALSSSLLACGIGAWLGTCGVAAPISCTGQSILCCILRHFAFAHRCVTPPTDHGSMSSLIFGLTKATQPPHKMRQRMRQTNVVCLVQYK